MRGTQDKANDGAFGTGVPVKRACFCVGVFFVLMLLFNGVAMYESAKLLEYGHTRDFWVMVLRPIERVSRFSCLFNVRQRSQDTVGKRLNQESGKRK